MEIVTFIKDIINETKNEYVIQKEKLPSSHFLSTAVISGQQLHCRLRVI